MEGEILIVDCGLGFADETMLGVDLLLPDISYLLDSVMQKKKTIAEAQKIQQGLRPLRELYQLPTAQEETQLSIKSKLPLQEFEQKKQSFLQNVPEQQRSTITPEELKEKAGLEMPKIQEFVSKRNQVAETLGITPEQLDTMTLGDLSTFVLSGLRGAQKEKAELSLQPQPVITREEAVKMGEVSPTTRIVKPEPQSPIDKEKGITERFDKRLVKSYRDSYISDPIRKQLDMQGLSNKQMESLIDLARNKNQVAFSGASTKAAKAMGETGMLTESDVTRYTQAGSLVQKTADKLNKMIRGTPTDLTLDDIQQIAFVMNDAYNNKIKEIQDYHATTMSENLGIDINEASRLLGFSQRTSPQGKQELSGKTKRGISYKLEK